MRPSHANVQFDPEEVGASEAKQWKAYYNKDFEGLMRELVHFLRKTYPLSSDQATSIAQLMGEAALIFSKTTSNYEVFVLPSLVKAYTKLQEATRSQWNAEKVARAELAWWVARRTPERNSPKQVGTLISQLYTEIYGKSNEHILRAGLLRAEAAHQRDLAAKSGTPDWEAIQKTLIESYTALKKGVN